MDQAKQQGKAEFVIPYDRQALAASTVKRRNRSYPLNLISEKPHHSGLSIYLGVVCFCNPSIYCLDAQVDSLGFEELHQITFVGQQVFLAYLIVVAHYRRTVALDEAQAVAAPPVPDTEVLDALKTLPEQYRVALYLFYYENYSAKEIAEAMGKTEANVTQYLSRGRRKMRVLLEDVSAKGRI